MINNRRKREVQPQNRQRSWPKRGWVALFSLQEHQIIQIHLISRYEVSSSAEYAKKSGLDKL